MFYYIVNDNRNYIVKKKGRNYITAKKTGNHIAKIMGIIQLQKI